ncbi:uncharacterized protein LOC141595248 [Silene latifolia]|uniref:uncharacterized protein LOC141595248 n=1 Tax=Silene latifolia TaxID=37657 RepID=UPI003D772498
MEDAPPKKDIEVKVPKKIKVPFPHRLAKALKETQFGKFMEVVKNLQVAVPFTELITQIPSYTKYMKDILTKKRTFDDVETIAFTAECRALLKNKSPPKLKVPGSFSIPSTIDTYTIDKALFDLGTSVNVMSYSICDKLNMGVLKCTSVTLQMVDRSIKCLLGVLADVPVKVGKFFIPVDFIVLDKAEDAQIPIILGRPFLQTVGAVIDVKNKVTYNLNSAMKSLMLEESCYSVDVLNIIDGVIEDSITRSLAKDHLEALLLLESFVGDDEIGWEEVDTLRVIWMEKSYHWRKAHNL